MVTVIDNKIRELKKDGKEIKKEIRQRTIGYIVAAFGLVAGLAWNDAVKTLIENLFPLGKGTLLAKFIYAISITLVLVVISVYLVRFSEKKSK